MRLLALAVVVAVVGGGIAVAAAFSRGDPSPSDPVAPSAPPPTESPPPPPPDGTTYRDFIYATSVVTGPTAHKAQSKLWFAHGSWFGGLFQPSSNQLNIFRLDRDTQQWVDTGTLVDERPFADPDFLWTGEHLYVVSAGSRSSPSNAARVLRFSYDVETDRFTLDPNFPVTILETGARGMVIAIDSEGTLWVTFALEGRVWMVHSLEHDAQWSAPFQLPFAQAVVERDDISAVIAFGPGRIGVMWSNQLLDSVYFTVHEDGAADDAWSQPETILDGVGAADAHLNLKTYPLGDGSGVVAALKTSLDDGQAINSLDPLLLLAVRDDGGTWATHLVGQVRNHHTRAVVMVDEDARMFYVAATSPDRGGTIYYKRSSIDRIVFDTGKGVPLVTSAVDVRINNPTSSKQSLTRESGLLVLASDNETGRYLHGIVDLGGGLPPADPADPARAARPAPPDPLSPVTYIRNDFEPWSIGTADGTAWLVRPADPPHSVSIADDGDGGRALRIAQTPAGAGVRACRGFPEVAGARLQVDVRVRVNALGSADTSILSLRGSGGEAASVRVTDLGVFAWFDGAVKVRSALVFQPGTWYRIAATIDQEARTYDMTIASDDRKVLVTREGLTWRSADVRNVREICVENGPGDGKQRIDLAEAQVLQEPGN